MHDCWNAAPEITLLASFTIGVFLAAGLPGPATVAALQVNGIVQTANREGRIAREAAERGGTARATGVGARSIGILRGGRATLGELRSA